MQIQSKVGAALAVLMILLFTASCSSVPPPAVSVSALPSSDWDIQLIQSEVKDKLHTDVGTTLYDGSVADTAYDDAPQQGNIFLLVELSVSKAKPGGTAFAWENLSVRDSAGTAYKRMANDAFLASHNYKRLPGTDLKLGGHDGWVCFEIPITASKAKLSLVYSLPEGDYEIAIQ